jgi:tetratricopeptide (TPR) repeat protein
MNLIRKSLLFYLPCSNTLILFLSFLLTFPLSLYAGGDSFQQGINEYQKENYEEALELFKKAKAESPDSSEISYYLGLTFRQTGDFQAAAQHFRDAIREKPAFRNAYLDLIETLYGLDDLKAAKNWITQAQKQGANPARLAFVEGMILLKEDHNREAIKAFEKARAMDPSLSHQTDLQIAVAYTKDRRFSLARQRLQALIQGDPNSEFSVLARDYEADIRKNLEKYKSWGVWAGIAYQYDDNVVLKPTGVIPGVVITGDKDSSIINSLNAYYTPFLEGNWLLSNQYTVYANNYFNTTSHNLLNQTFSVNPGYNFGRSTVTWPVTYSHVWFSGSPYLGVLSVRPNWSINLLPGHVGQGSLGYARRWMYQPPLIADEDRDANIIIGSLGYSHSFGERGAINLFYEFTRDMTAGRNWANDGHRINCNLLWPISEKMSFSLSGELFYQDYSQIHSIFGVMRSDKTYSGSIGLVYRLWKFATLNLQYYRAKADSNIFIYDYQRDVYTIGIQFFF